MEAQLLSLGYVKEGDRYFSFATMQQFMIRVDNTLKPPFYSAFVPWGKRDNGSQLYASIGESSSIHKLHSRLTSIDCPPGELILRGKQQPHYITTE